MSATKNKLSFLCISCYFKGEEFLKACKEAGNTVYLVTDKNLENKPWPKDSIDEIFYMQEAPDGNWNIDDLVAGMAHMMRSRKIDRIVALDDFDVEKAAHLREHFRIPGMGQTTHRFFRDKLAMLVQAQDAGINVPPFSALFNDEEINHYTQTVSPPWVVKPRSEASATGIKKVHSAEELWDVLNNKIKEDRHLYLIEQFKPGTVYHVDSLSQNGKIIFSRVSRYLSTPMEVAHGGGIFRSATVPLESKEDKALQRLNAKVMKSFGMQFSASHSEYIESNDDGKYYFLETASRVGGAHLAEMVEASSGINLWREWAKLETAMAKGTTYKLPKVQKNNAGILVSLSKFQHPDMSSFTDKEIWWKLDMEYHVGLIVKSRNGKKILSLLDDYAIRVANEFHAAVPPSEKSTH